MVIMKRIPALLVGLFLLFGTTAFAVKQKDEQPIPAWCAAILKEWNATDADELYQNILDHMRNTSLYESAGAFSPNNRPCSICFGWTTKELISNKKNWDLAIVSSKDVDLQALADAELIMRTGYDPSNRFALHQWLAPEKLQALLPQDPLMLYFVYFYDYIAQTDDVIMLICQADIGRKQDNPRSPFSFSGEIMKKRSPESIRAIEGLHIVNDWTEAELLTHAAEWDMATLMIDADDKLETLDQAGLLYDFSQDGYFAARTVTRPLEHVSSVRYCELPSSILSSNGRMIGIPFSTIREDQYDGQLGVMILNAQSPFFERAHAYAVHWMKSLEWAWTTKDKMWPHGWDLCIYKDEVDW